MKSDLIQSFSKPWRKDGEKTRQISIHHGYDKQKTWQIFPNALFPPLRPHISRQSDIICASLETLLLNISNQEISPPCRICRNSQVLETRHVFLPARGIWKTDLWMILTLNPSAWNWWYAKSVRGFIGLDAQFRLNFINTQSHREAGGRLALSTK